MSPEPELPPYDERLIRRRQVMIERAQDVADALGSQLPIETNVETHAKLKIRLREKEKEIVGLLQEQRDAIARDSRERLHSALIRLDFEDQMRVYRKLTQEKRLGAFVVLPESPTQAGHIDIAAGLLVKRLRRALPDHIATAPLRMSYRRLTRRSGPDGLWDELARRVGLSTPAEKETVRANVVERLETQNVVILLTDLDSADLDDCIDQFWIPLVSATAEARPARSLVLVLIDLDGETRMATSDIPTWLPIRPLSKDDISLWLRALADDCPVAWLGVYETAAHEIIAAASHRNPDGVLEEICIRSEWNCPEFHLEDWFAI